MTDFQNVGTQFVQHYYNVFDTQREQLGDLYTEDSMLTFEGEQFKGLEGIGGKYGALPSIKHKVDTADYHPSLQNGIIAFITGEISIDGGPGIKFSQVFNLAVGGKNGYYVHNDLFRMNMS